MMRSDGDEVIRKLVDALTDHKAYLQQTENGISAYGAFDDAMDQTMDEPIFAVRFTLCRLMFLFLRMNTNDSDNRLA